MNVFHEMAVFYTWNTIYAEVKLTVLHLVAITNDTYFSAFVCHVFCLGVLLSVSEYKRKKLNTYMHYIWIGS